MTQDVRLGNGGGAIDAKINFAQATRDFHGIPKASAKQNSRPDDLFLSYFLTSYPCDTVQQTCHASNANLAKKNIKTVKLTPHLWFKFMGIILAMTLQELPNRHAYWDDDEANQETKRIIHGPNFGRFINFNGSGDIDWHNRLRAFLALEKIWITWSWWKRVFGTVFAMIVTDAYLMYVFDQKNQQDHQLLTRQAFIEILAYKMIHNNITDTPNGHFKQRRRARSDDDKEDIEVDEWSELEDNDSSSKASCRYKSLWNLKKFKNGNKRGYGLRCSECGDKAYNYCSTCSTTKGQIITVCSERVCRNTGKSCKHDHEANSESFDQEN